MKVSTFISFTAIFQLVVASREAFYAAKRQPLSLATRYTPYTTSQRNESNFRFLSDETKRTPSLSALK
jgi:hypothetical protein